MELSEIARDIAAAEVDEAHLVSTVLQHDALGPAIVETSDSEEEMAVSVLRRELAREFGDIASGDEQTTESTSCR